MGWQDRRRLPLCAGGSRVRARLYALIKAIRERRRKAFRVSPFSHHRLRERSGMTPEEMASRTVEKAGFAPHQAAGGCLQTTVFCFVCAGVTVSLGMAPSLSATR
jgi:hypothetical protein